MKRTATLITVAVLTFLTVYGIHDINQSHSKLHLQRIELQSTDVKLKKLEVDYNNTLKQVEEGKQTEQQLKATQDQLKKLEQEKVDLEGQLQAKADKNKVYAAEANCGDPKSCIYSHESGNNPASVNSSGCRGLGQACPGSKLPCGADYACQDAYFTQYAITRYGSWANAWSFWQVAHWW